MTTSRPAALLVSLHDVSNLTLADCEQAITPLREAGVAAVQRTVLAIPHHDEQIPQEAHPPMVRFLRDL